MWGNREMNKFHFHRFFFLSAAAASSSSFLFQWNRRCRRRLFIVAFFGRGRRRRGCVSSSLSLCFLVPSNSVERDAQRVHEPSHVSARTRRCRPTQRQARQSAKNAHQIIQNSVPGSARTCGAMPSYVRSQNEIIHVRRAHSTGILLHHHHHRRRA